MTKTLLIAGALAALTAPAFAADIIIPQPPIDVPAETTDWTGFYAGVNGGVGGGTFEHPFFFDSDPDLTGSLDITAFGFLGGFQAGYNYQANNLVFGIEGDIQASNVEGRLMGSLDIGPGDGFLSGATTVDWFATLRPRLGFANDRFLVYVTGGVAYGSVTSSYSYDFGGGEVTDGSTSESWGWTAGAGIEYMLADNVSFKTEYLYTDLGAQSIIDEDAFTLDSNVAFHTVRAGVNFLF